MKHLAEARPVNPRMIDLKPRLLLFGLVDLSTFDVRVALESAHAREDWDFIKDVEMSLRGRSFAYRAVAKDYMARVIMEDGRYRLAERWTGSILGGRIPRLGKRFPRLRANSHESSFRLTLAESLQSQGRLEEADYLLSVLASRNASVWLQYNPWDCVRRALLNANRSFLNGDLETCGEQATLAVEKQIPKLYQPSRMYRCAIQFARCGQVRSARQCLVEAQPNSCFPTLTHRLFHLAQAETASAEGRTEDSISAFLELVRSGAPCGLAYLRASRIATDETQSQSFLRAILEHDPESGWVPLAKEKLGLAHGM
jgi:hypothetical protein